MRNGKCIRCGSAAVVARPNGLVPGGQLRMYSDLGGFYRAVDVVTFLCTACGYYENYVADAKRLAELGQKWQKVTAAEQAG